MELGTWNTWDSFYPQEKLPLRYNNSLEVQHCLASGHWRTSESLYSIAAKECEPCLEFCQALNHVLLYGPWGSAIPCLVRNTPPLITKEHFWLWLNLSSRHSHMIFLTCAELAVLKAVKRFSMLSGLSCLNHLSILLIYTVRMRVGIVIDLLTVVIKSLDHSPFLMKPNSF